MGVEQVVAAALGEPRGSSRAHIRSDRAGPTLITKRETEVAELVADGLSNKEIATRLVISQRTAETHVEGILTKLGFPFAR